MYHRIKLGIENPPRSELSVRRMSLAYVKEENMETRNPEHNNKPFFCIHA